jgi:pyridoxine 4-dehydrogenase
MFRSRSAVAVVAFVVVATTLTTTTTTVVVTALSSPTPINRRDFVSRSVAISTSPLWIPTQSVQAAEDAAFTKKTKLPLPPIGLGCWAWGDSLFWGYNPKNDDQLKEVFDYAVENYSPVLLDTAEVYGFGRSETLVGEYTAASQAADKDKVVIATKFAALPFRTKPESVVKACEASVKRLGGRPIDLYQIHFPGAWANEAYWDGMAQAYEKGLIKAVGVSNYGVDATRACHKALEKRGIALASNQIQYSLLYRFPEDNGLLQACDDLGIQVLAYSPLALGLLTGKYRDAETVQSISGPRKQLFEKVVKDPQFAKVLDVMTAIADSHSTKTKQPVTLSQVAINWCRAKGTIPIPGARNLRQVQSNYASLDWNLQPEEIQALDEVSSKISYIQPGASPFPSYDKDLQLKMFDS